MQFIALLSGNEEKPIDGGQHLSPEPSPDDFSSPNPDQAAPLLQAQQRTPSRGGRAETRPGSQNSATKTDADVPETAAVQRAENKDLVGKAEMEGEPTTKKDSEQDGEEVEREREDKKDEDDADEGLPLSRESDIENGVGSEGCKEPPDANNNSLDTPQDVQDELIDIPELPAQVSLKHKCQWRCLCCHHWEMDKQKNLCCVSDRRRGGDLLFR